MSHELKKRYREREVIMIEFLMQKHEPIQEILAFTFYIEGI